MKLANHIRALVGLSLFILLTVFFTGCQSETDSDTHLIYIERYDRLQAVFALHKDKASFLKMKKDNPRATSILYDNILSLDDSSEAGLRAFYADTTLLKLVKDVERTYKDLSFVEDSLNMAFVNLKQMIPTLRIPVIYTQISALSQSIVVSDSIVGISLDKYLGSSYPLYAEYYYPYQRRLMTSSRIVPDVLFYYLCSEYAVRKPSISMAEWLVTIGKIQWLVRKAAGYKDWEESMGYTREECEWMENNESKVWYYMLNNVLPGKKADYSHEGLEGDYLKNYFHTNVPPYMPMWMGARLVGHYMKTYRNTTALELLNCDYRRIYETAGISIYN